MRIEPVENQNYRKVTFNSKMNFMKPMFKAGASDELLTTAAEHAGNGDHTLGWAAGFLALLGTGWALLRGHKSSVDKKLAQAEKEAAEKLKQEAEARLKQLKEENDALSKQLDEINNKILGTNTTKPTGHTSNSGHSSGSNRGNGSTGGGGSGRTNHSGGGGGTSSNTGRAGKTNPIVGTSKPTGKPNSSSADETIQELENWNRGYNERLDQLEQQIVDTKETREVLSTSARLAQIDATKSFDRIRGYETQKDFLTKKFILPLKNNKKSIPNTILMYGPKGTGKTSFVTAVVDETGCNRISLISSLNEKEDIAAFSEALKKSKQHYEKTGKETIIQIDEVEGFFAGSNSSIKEFSDLINTASDKYHATIFATTNHPQEIDNQILQTVKLEKMLIPQANKKDIEEILKFVLKDFSESTVNYNELADLIINRAGKDAYSNARVYNMARDLAAKSANDALNAKIKQQQSSSIKQLTQQDIRNAIMQKDFVPDIKKETLESFSEFSINGRGRINATGEQDSIEELLQWQEGFNSRMDELERTTRESQEIIELNATKNLLAQLNNIRSFARIQGYTEQKKFISDKFLQPLRNNQPLPNTILMYGPKGTGKTLFIKAAIEESGCNQISLNSSLDELEDLKAFKEAADKAKQYYEKTGKITIIQADEIDGIFVGSSETIKEYQNIINNLSSKYHAVLFATTNHPQRINKNIINTSKFEKMLIPQAGKEDIAEIMKFVLKDFSESTINYDKLAQMIISKAGENAFSNARIYDKMHDFVTSRVDNALTQKIKQNKKATFSKITEQDIINLIIDKNFTPDISKSTLSEYKNIF